MKRNSEYYIAKLKKFYFFEILIIRLDTKKIGNVIKLYFIVYYRFFHLFIEFSFFLCHSSGIKN